MFKTDNSLHVFVANAMELVDVPTAAVGDLIVANEANGLLCVSGAEVAYDAGTGAAASGLFRIGQKVSSTEVRWSPIIKASNVTKRTQSQAGSILSSADARTQQVTTIASIPNVANTRYTLRVNFTHNTALYSEQSDIQYFEYVTGDTVATGEIKNKFIAKINAAGGAKGKVVAASLSDTSFKITGLAQDWTLGLHLDTVVSFDTTLDGFGAATNVLTTAASKGINDGKNIAELEWFAVGANGAPYRHGSVPSNQDLITLYADSTKEYNVVTLECDLVDPGHAVAGSGKGKCTIVIAYEEDVANDPLETVLKTGTAFFE